MGVSVTVQRRHMEIMHRLAIAILQGWSCRDILELCLSNIAFRSKSRRCVIRVTMSMSIIFPLPQSMQYKDTLTLLDRDVSAVKKSYDIIFAPLQISIIEKACSSCDFDFLFLF